MLFNSETGTHFIVDAVRANMVRQNTIRSENIAKEKFNKKRSMTRLRSMKSSKSYWYQTKRNTLEEQNYGKHAQVREWLQPVGNEKSLPTNVLDPPDQINNNSLRSRRKFSYKSALPEGGKMYPAGVNVDNFVEERRDKSYKSGTWPSIIKCHKGYESEYMQRFNEAAKAYGDRIRSTQLVSKHPLLDQDYRSSKRKGYNTNYVSYAKQGFGRNDNTKFDATINKKQGASWVGTSPYKMYESVNKTQMKREDFEFQKVCPQESAQSKIAMSMSKTGCPPPDVVSRERERLARSQRHCTNWKTMYTTTHTNFVGNPAAPQLGATLVPPPNTAPANLLTSTQSL